MPHVWEMAAMERRYSVPPSTISEPMGRGNPSEDLHAWSIYRQNLNSDFTDSALGSSEKSPLPYGNFQLRESTVNSILSHPRYGPTAAARQHHAVGSNMYAYLKFGLPRVFPPVKGLREGSSGYDSSEEGFAPAEARNVPDGRFHRSRSDPDFQAHQVIRRQQEIGGGGGGGDSEVAWWANGSANNQHHHNSSSNIGHNISTNNMVISNTNNKQRKLRSSSSEANLLNHESYYLRQAEEQPTHHRVRDVQGTKALISRRAAAPSKAGSQLSGISHATRSHVGVFGGAIPGRGLGPRDSHLLNEDFFPKDPSILPVAVVATESETGGGGVFLKYPHVQVRGLTFEEPLHVPGKLGLDKRWFRVLDDVNFEVRGGELLGIMATSEYEGTALLNILANRPTRRKVRLRADILVNGSRMSLRALWDRVAYVQQDCSFAPDMSVRQTLLFTSLLQEPGNQSRTFDTKGRINALIEDLGLGLVKHTRVKNLTMSEKRRLNVACRLLLDTDIVLLDEPTKGMDIFDTFFLVEYLRQWAARGRIVILTIQPPTYEIFTMLTQVALMSTGRLMFFGKRREMLPYFAFIEYPCPAYKNPADYYLDLVTLDNLSPEAMLESSQRVDLLAEIFRRRQEALSDPGPAGIPPPKIKRANFVIQMLALWIRALIYMFPYNLITFSRQVAMAAAMSILIGAIFFSVRLGREQEHVMDRISFHYVMLGVAVWPIMLASVSEAWSFKDPVTKDVNDGLYSKPAYILSKMQYSFPAAGGVFLAYIIPAYCMAGMKNETDNQTFSVYVGYMLLYLFGLRALGLAMAYCCRSRHVASSVGGLVATAVLCTSGWSVHLQDLSVISFWLQWASPARWTLEQLVAWDLVRADARTAHTNVTYLCTHNPTVVQDQGGGAAPPPGIITQPRILVRAECGLQHGAQALDFWGFRGDWATVVPVLAVVSFGVFWQFWAMIAFVACRQRQKKSRGRLLRIYQ